MTDKQEKTQQIDKNPRKRLNLVLLCISAFFSQAAGYMVFAYLGPQAINIFGAPTVVGTLLPMASSIVGLIGLIPVGIYVDRSGRRKEAIMIGYAILTIFNILMALMTNWPEMLIFRTIGAGAQTLVMFLYTVLFIFQLPPERRGMAIGLYMGISTIGSMIFTLFAGALVQSYGYGVITGYQMIYWVAALLGALAIVFLAPVKIPLVKASNVTMKSFGTAIANRGVWYAGLVWLVSGIGFLAFQTGIPVVLPSPAFGADAAFVGLVYAIVGIITMIGMFIGGGLTDKLGPRTIMALSGIIGAVISLIFLFASNYLYVAIIFWAVIFFMGFGFSAPNASATASVGPELAGTAVNTETLFYSIGAIIAGIVSGITLAYGFSTLAIVAVIVLVVSGLMALGIPKIKKQEKT